MYRLQFRGYRRPFLTPLKTHHGTWKMREGLILRLSDAIGRVGWGEIAPIPWFGSETLAAALRFCQQCGETIDEAGIAAIAEALPACQFGFETAAADLVAPFSPPQPIDVAALLPAGEAALWAWPQAWKQGRRSMKWKIGVDSFEREITLFQRLVSDLPPAAKLRLDANGGLTPETAKRWLEAAESVDCVEFIEQPLPPSALAAMVALQGQYATAIALDESVATLTQLEDCYGQGWRGIFVVKAAIAGSPSRLRQLARKHDLNLVFSSVFETAIARTAVLHLAGELASPGYALGFGTDTWLAEFDPKAGFEREKPAEAGN
jgi:O-succinylbenzoate synthase